MISLCCSHVNDQEITLQWLGMLLAEWETTVSHSSPPCLSNLSLVPSFQVSSEGNAGQALGMEAFSTFQLALTIFAVEDHQRRELGEPSILAIGFSVVAGALAAVRAPEGPF